MNHTEFLLARIAEEMPEPVPANEGGGYVWSSYRHAGTCDLLGAWGEMTCDCDGAARVLAECEAKRRIVAEWQHMENVAEMEWESDHAEDALAFEAKSEALGVALRLLALPYADHPDYREEWKP